MFITKMILSFITKSNFTKQYGIGSLPKSVKVKKGKKQERNYYKLRYPYWSASKKDGTADLRVKSNSIIWRKSELHISNYILFSERPYDLVDVVNKLRLLGVGIDLCKEEKEKQLYLKEKRKTFAYNTDIQKLIEYYSETPTNFEKLCSELFESMGYISELTPPTNDGGYDILLNKDGEESIVECKCYSTDHKIGRPSIQKLVGANNIVLADNMIFITTSDFSASAIAYSEEVGVELINGRKLMNLLSKQGFFDREQIDVNMLEWQLEVTDLYPYVPDDIYEEFFNNHISKR